MQHSVENLASLKKEQCLPGTIFVVEGFLAENVLNLLISLIQYVETVAVPITFILRNADFLLYKEYLIQVSNNFCKHFLYFITYNFLKKLTQQKRLFI